MSSIFDFNSDSLQHDFAHFDYLHQSSWICVRRFIEVDFQPEHKVSKKEKKIRKHKIA